MVAAVLAGAGFAALFAVLPSQGSGVEVLMRGFRFRPDSIKISVGGAVTFVNEDDVTHTATCQGCSQDTGDVQPGLLRTVTFPRAGTFHLVCRYHGEQGMIAILTVGGAGPTSPSPSASLSPTPTGT